jgi:hypothetical protein
MGTVARLGDGQRRARRLQRFDFKMRKGVAINLLEEADQPGEYPLR